MPEGDIGPRLILAVLLAALAVALAFFGFLAWRRRAAGRPGAASRAGSRPWAPQPTGSPLTQRQSLGDPLPEGLEQHYGVLGLGPGAPPGEASGAYRRLSRKWNPDRFREGSKRRKEAEQRSRSINVAFDTIRGTWSESEREVAEAFDQISSSTDASPGAKPALIESWLALGVGAKLAAIWLVLFTLFWLAPRSEISGSFLLAVTLTLFGLPVSYVLVGPGRHWANLLLFAPFIVAGAATDALGPFPVEDQDAAFEAQNWRAFALVFLLIPTQVGIWIGRTVRRRLRGRQHVIAAIFLLLLLFVWVESCPVKLDCLPGITGGC